MNKNLEGLAPLYNIISQNAKAFPVVFQMNHFSKYFQIMKI